MSVVNVLVDIVGYHTARVILPLMSLGRIKVAHWTSERPGGWFGCYRDEKRRPVFTSEMAGSIGLLLWLLPLVIFIVATGR